MRKLLLFTIATFLSAGLMAQTVLDGTWKIAYEAGAIGVGPGQGDISWWSNSEDDLTTRACYFDDEYVFSEDGSFMNVLGDETWLETWQGVAEDQCGTPVAPHDGSNAATYTWDETAGELTLNGVGAYLGLSKVYNGGELTSPGDAPEAITYIVEFSEDDTRMTVDIDISGGWWRFILDKEEVVTFDVTMNVDMSTAEGFDPAVHSVYVSGNIFGWQEPGTNPDLMLTQVDETLIYTITASLEEPQEVQYKYFSDVVASGWDGGEWAGDPNRTVYIAGETTLEDTWMDKPSMVSFMVDMSTAEGFNPDTTEVYMSGSFAGWTMPGEVDYWKMSPSGDDPTIYTLNALLYHGDYQYKYFLVYNGVASWDNGEWAGDPNRELTVDTTMKVEDVWATLNPGINDVVAGPIVSVYPNPASSVIHVRFFEEQNIDRIEIYNLTGMLMKSVKGIAGENVSIDVSGLSKGTYLISVFEDNNVQTAKFIIE